MKSVPVLGKGVGTRSVRSSSVRSTSVRSLPTRLFYDSPVLWFWLSSCLWWIQVLSSSIISDALSVPAQGEQVIAWGVCSDGWLSAAANHAENVFATSRTQLTLHVFLPADVPACVQRDSASGARPGLVTSAGCWEDEEGEWRKIWGMGSTWQRQQEKDDREVRSVVEAGLMRTENAKGINSLSVGLY